MGAPDKLRTKILFYTIILPQPAVCQLDGDICKMFHHKSGERILLPSYSHVKVSESESC